MKHAKVAIIGAGSVGATTAFSLILRNLVSEILIVDIDTKRCKGEVADLADILSYSSSSVVRSASFKEVHDADIIIIAAGQRQKPGQTRLELLKANQTVIKNIVASLQPLSPDTILIMITNPVDILTHLVYKTSGHPAHKIIGSGTLLDTRRLCRMLGNSLHISESSIQAYVIGEHGDDQFVAWSTASVAGRPIATIDSIAHQQLKTFEQQAKNEAYEIINCKGATYYGVATCVAQMCEAILYNQCLVLPVSCYIKELDVCLSMPTVLNEQGIAKIITIPLNEQEQQQLQTAAQKLKEAYKAIK